MEGLKSLAVGLKHDVAEGGDLSLSHAAVEEIEFDAAVPAVALLAVLREAVVEVGLAAPVARVWVLIGNLWIEGRFPVHLKVVAVNTQHTVQDIAKRTRAVRPTDAVHDHRIVPSVAEVSEVLSHRLLAVLTEYGIIA